MQALQWTLGLEVIPAVVYGAAAFVVPESPRYLVAVGEEKSAGVPATIERPAPTCAPGWPRSAEGYGGAQAGPGGAARAVLGLLPVVWVGVVLSLLQQLTGISVISTYSSPLWRFVGIDQRESPGQPVHLRRRRGGLGEGRPLAVAGALGTTRAPAAMAWAFSDRADVAVISAERAVVALPGLGRQLGPHSPVRCCGSGAFPRRKASAPSSPWCPCRSSCCGSRRPGTTPWSRWDETGRAPRRGRPFTVGTAGHRPPASGGGRAWGRPRGCMPSTTPMRSVKSWALRHDSASPSPPPTVASRSGRGPALGRVLR